MPDLAPTIRVSPVNTARGQFKLIELSVSQPGSGAIAIVLDLSDSCAPPLEDIRRLSKLIALRPRRTPVWVYAMSSTRPLLEEPVTVGHLIDKTYDPEQWLSDRQRVSEFRFRGSLLRPTLESIGARCHDEDVAGVAVVVLTDGEVLDADPIELPPNLAVVGLISGENHDRAQHWRRVIGAAPLCRLGDPALDAVVRADASPFYGLCKVQCETELPGVSLSRFDGTTGAITPTQGLSVEWNFADGQLYLSSSRAGGDVDALNIICTSDRYRARARLSLHSAAQRIPAEIVQAFASAVTAGPHSSAKVVVDLRAGQTGFDELWRAAARAAELADRGERWIDKDGQLRVFRPDDGVLLSEAQALLCLCSADPRCAAPTDARLLVFAMMKSPRPAIAWSKENAPDFILVHSTMTLDYDPFESRWMLTCGTETAELNPRGGQRLRADIGIAPAGKCVAWFSGDLK